MRALSVAGWAADGSDQQELTVSRLALACFLTVHFVKVKDGSGPHAGHMYIKGMPAEHGGYHVYASQVAKLKYWLASPHFCPTDNDDLKALQD